MSIPRHTFPIAVVALLNSLGMAAAGTFTWDSSGANPANPVDGAGTWNTSNLLWSDGATDSAWNNAGNDTAVFGNANGAAGTVSLGSAITAGGITFNLPGSGNYLISSGTLTLGGSTPTLNTVANAEISSAIIGTTGLVKTGTGKLTLSGTNTYSGGTQISAGTLSFSAGVNLPTGSITLDGGTLEFTGTTYTPINRALVITTSGGSISANGSNSPAGYLAYTGGISYSGSGNRSLTLTGTNTQGNTLSSALTDGTGGVTSLVKEGSSVWLVRGNNKTYTGDTVINAGTLRTYGDAANELPTNNTVKISAAGTLSLNNDQSIANLQDGTGGGGVIREAFTSATLTVESGSFSGQIRDNGTSRLIGLTKSTTGVLRLSGTNNTYGNGTTVTAGTLIINNASGNALGSGAVSVTGTLAGNGFAALGGSNSVNVGTNGAIAPGDSAQSGGIGTLTLSGSSTSGAILNMQAGSSFSFTLGAADANDTVRFFSYAGASDFLRDSGGVMLNFTGAQNGTFDLFSFYSNAGTTLTSAGFTELSSNFVLGSGLSGFTPTWDYSTTGVISLTLNAVPEPSVIGLAVVGLAAGLARLRRKK
ncbi:hypothetical protein BH09VER1_BH09VER1_42960 [soil metagenome]